MYDVYKQKEDALEFCQNSTFNPQLVSAQWTSSGEYKYSIYRYITLYKIYRKADALFRSNQELSTQYPSEYERFGNENNDKNNRNSDYIYIYILYISGIFF